MITSYMLYNSSVLATFLRNGQSMDKNMEESSMQLR